MKTWRYMTEFLGGEMTFRGDYPEWPFNPNSKICALCKKIYEEQTGNEASIEMIHAGLECGLFSDAIEGLDAIAIGPTIHNCHTPDEYLPLDSFERFYEFLKDILKRLA